MQTHEITVGETTQELKTTSAHHDTLIALISGKLDKITTSNNCSRA